MRKAWMLSLVVMALAGCASLNPEQVAKQAAEQGRPCEAAELIPTTHGTKYYEECNVQKDEKAREREVKAEDESYREGKRLAEEGR